MQVQGMGSQMRMMQEMMRARMGGGNPSQVLSAGMPAQMPSASDVMKGADTDGSGSLSLSEFKAFNPAKMSGGTAAALNMGSDSMKEDMFKGLDADQNGSIDTSELGNAPPLKLMSAMGDGMALGGSGSGGGFDISSLLGLGNSSSNAAQSTKDSELKKLLDLVSGSS